MLLIPSSLLFQPKVESLCFWQNLQKTKNAKKLLEGVDEKEDNGDTLRLEDSGDEVMLDEGQEEGVLIQETKVEKEHKNEHESPHKHRG